MSIIQRLTPQISVLPASRLALIVALALLAPAVTAQDLITGDDPAKILEIARGYGSAELETDSNGAPRIRGRIEGAPYSVLFFGCNAGVNCASIQFWTYTPPPTDPLVAVNVWNRDSRFGKAYIDRDGDVVVEMDVNLWGGVAQKNLDDTFDWWRAVLARVGEEFKPAPRLPLFPMVGEDGKSL